MLGGGTTILVSIWRFLRPQQTRPDLVNLIQLFLDYGDPNADADEWWIHPLHLHNVIPYTTITITNDTIMIFFITI